MVTTCTICQPNMFVTQKTSIRDVYADIWSCWAFLSCIIVTAYTDWKRHLFLWPKRNDVFPCHIDPQKLLVILQIKIWLWPMGALINSPYFLLSKLRKLKIQRCLLLNCSYCTAESTEHHLWLPLSLCVCLLNYCTIFSESWQSGHRCCIIFSEIATIRT